MRTSVTHLSAFYQNALGQMVRDIVREKLKQAWGGADRLRVAGVGYTAPFLDVFDRAERSVALVPSGIGVQVGTSIPTCMIDDHAWPLPDASIDRLLIIHGLEEVSGPRRFIREAWRVLADDGLMIIATANRRGPWAMVESSPFAAGRPYSRRQLDSFLKAMMFQPTAYATALHFPPVQNPLMLKAARTWEMLGATIESWNLPPILPNLAGLNFVEARKSAALPITGSRSEVFRPGILLPGGAAEPARRQGRVRTNRAASADKFGSVGRDGENALGPCPEYKPKH